jgi:O-antigen/teichoic acid export membrane protein
LTKSKKDLIILSLGKALQVIIALVSIRILTELLSEQEVGNYYLLLTVLTLFNFAFLNPLGQYY